MNTRGVRRGAAATGLALMWGAAWGTLCAADTLRPEQLRRLAAERVCLVTARDGFGLPTAYATGFVFGNGRFVLTDLAALARPGVVRATVRFEDGTTAEAATFGFADAALGVAAIRLEGDAAGRQGLALAPDLPALDGSAAATSAGWEWAAGLKLLGGRLVTCGTSCDLASASSDPAPPLDLLQVNGARVPGASGSPILDAEGRVVGIWLERLSGGAPADVGVPAATVRRGLLAAKAELKPLAQLPPSLWAARVRSIPGPSVPPARLAASVRSLRLQLRCTKCNGTGQVRVRRLTGVRKWGGLSYPQYTEVNEICPDCRGEGAIFRETTYGHLGAMAEQAARVCFDPDLEVKAREATLGGVRETLAALAQLGDVFRDALLDAVAQAVRDAADGPQGLVVWAQVLGRHEGSGGGYVMLAPKGSARRLAARLSEVESGAAADAPAPWRYGRWILAAGLAEGTVNLEGEGVLWFRPAVWVAAPSLGPPPEPTTPRTGDQPDRPQQPKPSEPGFFGM